MFWKRYYYFLNTIVPLPPNPCALYIFSGGSTLSSGVMSQKNLGGTIFARERSDQARGSVATERGEGVGGGCHARELFIFRLKNVQSGPYLRRKFRLDDMYYNLWVSVSRFDRSGKGYFFHEHNYANMHPKIIFAMYYITYNILIWRRYPDVETRERNERAWRGCDAVGCHSSAVSFYYLWYGAIYKRQYTDKH